MENIMKPEPHKIVSVIRQTAAEFTIRVACDKDPGIWTVFPAVSAENRRGADLCLWKRTGVCGIYHP